MNMKNLMKSALCLLMALLMVLSLAACGSQSTDTQDAAPQESEAPDEHRLYRRRLLCAKLGEDRRAGDPRGRRDQLRRRIRHLWLSPVFCRL